MIEDVKLTADAPVVGIPCDLKEIDGLPFHAVGEKYVTAVMIGAQAMPWLIPAFGPQFDIPALLDRLDGLLVTGSVSNVAVHHYGGAADRPESPQDPLRDATTLPMIEAALDAGLPLFCICRGIQELNVVLGGTLHTEVHALDGNLDHRALRDVEMNARYVPRQRVTLEPDGAFARILGKTAIDVNSLHWQAIDRPASRLAVEGRAEDGVIEAVRVKDAKNFALGVQWHPEFRVWESADSMKLFAAFGEAVRARAASRRGRRSAA
ncbi:MAG: gamma-glutamyl-gamma-aminobutyrate hydrolase family protein [Dongiaceae bacterium]